MNKCTYTALGDSLTNGFIAYVFDGFAFRIARYYRCRFNGLCFNNFGKPGLTSKELLDKLCNCKEMRKCICYSDIITITIGGNDLLDCTCDSYSRINKKLVNKAIKEFSINFPCILEIVRDNLCYNGDMYIATLYNPYCYKDPNYELVNCYIEDFNDLIKDEYFKSSYRYNVVDIYEVFERDKRKCWTLFNTPFRDPHPNSQGHYEITKAFLKTMDY